MDFTNINDPAGVKALLDKLRSSQAWQEAVVRQDADAQPAPQAPAPPVVVPNDGAGTGASAAGSSSVAALLSQLQSAPIWPSVPAPAPVPPSDPSAIPLPQPQPQPPPSRSDYARSVPFAPSGADFPPLPVASAAAPKQSPRTYTFQQALPHLGRLAEDATFVAAVGQMKQEQEALERKLWAERGAILKKHEDKVKVAVTKGNMIGVGISRHEADMMSDAFQKELRRFDAERVLPAWDGLVAKQQAALEARGVPAMFVTSSKGDREKQQRIVHIVEGMVDSV